MPNLFAQLQKLLKKNCYNTGAKVFQNRNIETSIKSPPLNLSKISVNLAIDFIFLSVDVNNPAIIKITPCPKANKNSINIAKAIFLPIAANAIIPAKIGVEQGVPAKAKVIPKSTGYKKMEFVEFVGIALIIVGVSKSKKPKSFKPITRSNDAINRVKYPPMDDAKTLPVTAHATPIIVKTIAVPKIKQLNCKKVLNGVSLEYPPTYPIIKGSIASEQGEIDASTPPINDAASIKYQAA